MIAEAWALVGVVVGGLLATTGQVGTALLGRRWARQDLAQRQAAEKAGRLFDFRRQAYMGFIGDVQSVYLDHWAEVTRRAAGEVPDDARQTEEDIARVHAAFVPVSAYGTEETSDAASQVVVRTIGFLFATQVNAAEAIDDLELARETFLERVRYDLGVDGATGLLRPDLSDVDFA